LAATTEESVTNRPRAIADVSFAGKAFCFTGALAHLKRTAAQREVRARGGYTLDVVNPQLDYLVIGDTPSPAWKFGNYGRKIEAARALATVRQGRPYLISESAFVEYLAFTPASDAVRTDEKVVVATYKFVIAPGSAHPDPSALEAVLRAAESEFGCHVAVTAHWIDVHADLFGPDASNEGRIGTAITCRFVRLLPLDEGVTSLLNSLQRAMEGVAGLDGSFHWFERVGGSADYVRLIRQMASTLWLPTLPVTRRESARPV
jgi:hypothetical protein